MTCFVHKDCNLRENLTVTASFFTSPETNLQHDLYVTIMMLILYAEGPAELINNLHKTQWCRVKDVGISFSRSRYVLINGIFTVVCSESQSVIKQRKLACRLLSLLSVAFWVRISTKKY